VLNPNGSTALGLPFSAARIRTSEAGNTVSENKFAVAGVICDNLLHSVVTKSESEAYWMSGLFNSHEFNRLVMKQALGEPPGIYTIPVKIMEQLKLEFDRNDPTHVQLAKTARELESSMRATVRRYIVEEKGIDLNTIDDSDQSPDVP